MKCVFFDRDGVVNFAAPLGEYIQTPDEFEVIPAFLDALRVVKKHGYMAVVITNQQGVGKGLYSDEDVEGIHQKLESLLQAEGLALDAVYYCPHLIKEECDCRKPEPGMFLQAAAKWDIDLKASWMVGDNFSDVEAGAAAGCRTILVSRLAHEGATHRIDRMDDLPPLLDRTLK